MKANTLVSWPSIHPKPTAIAFQKRRSNKPTLIKHLPMATPPDEKTIRQLNELAASRPFCTLHHVKKHEIL
jgi:hypothetical protein